MKIKSLIFGLVTLLVITSAFTGCDLTAISPNNSSINAASSNNISSTVESKTLMESSKKITSIISSYGNSLSTSSKSENVSFSIPNTQNTTEALKLYNDVMQNKVQIIQRTYKDSYDYGTTYQPFYINELNRNLELPDNCNLSKFTILDMDGDNTPEVVVEIDCNENGLYYEVLHYYNDKVYGYSFQYRAMEGLKTDGTFVGSSGANDIFILKASFSKDSLNLETLAYSESTSNYDSNGYPIIKFYIANKSVSKQEWIPFSDNQNAKKDVPWCEFNEQNIEKYF